MSDLFRREAVLHATRRLSGSVVLAIPMPVSVLGMVFAGIVVTALIFASEATYARKATVTGWLVPDQGLIRAAAPSAGIIRALLVKEGDLVDVGAHLAEIRMVTETASGNVGENIVGQLRAETEASLAKAQTLIERLNAEVAQVQARLAKLQDERYQLKTQMELQVKRLGLARDDEARGLEGVSKGVVSLRDRDTRRSTTLMAEQELAGHRRQVVSTEREISDLTARMSAIVMEKQTAAAESRSAQASLAQRMIDAEARRVQLVLSPVAGRVAALPVTAGQPVTLGATLAVVVPQAAKLEGELLAPSRAAGFIRPGQEVHLMLQGFPHQRFGTLKGEIKSISSTVLGPAELSIPGMEIKEPVFRVRVALPRGDIHAYGELIPLQPGMLLSADIVFDRRPLLQWLFDPLFAVARRS
jgi:membrane fusion protein